MLEDAFDAARRYAARTAKRFVSWVEDDGLDDEDWANRKAGEAAADPYGHFGNFANLMPHASFLPEQQVFTLETSPQADGTFSPRRVEAMGFVLELVPVCGADDDLARALSGILMQLPKESSLQIILAGDPRVHDYLDTYASLRTSNSRYRELAQKRVDWCIKGAYEGLFPSIPYRLRHLRLLLAITIPVEGAHAVGDLEQLMTIRTTVLGTLKTQQMHPRIWDAADWLLWMEFVANPQATMAHRDAKKRSHDPHSLLRNQAMHAGTVLRIRPRNMLFGEASEDGDDTIMARCMSVRETPQHFTISHVGSLVGDHMRQELQYPCPFVLCLGVMVLDFETTKSISMVKAARATTNTETPMARIMPEFAVKKRDWDVALASFNQGEGLVHLFHQLVLYDKPKNMDRAERAAEQIWRSRSFTLGVDRYMQCQAFQSTIPMALTPSFQEDLRTMQRYSTKTVSNAVHTAPVVGEWHGNGLPYLQLWGRQGQFMGIDFFDNPTGNYNGSLAAGSGAGKSVLGNELIASVRGSGGRAFVIDAGRSYMFACQGHGGQFIEFTPEHTPNLNPFPMIRDLESDDDAFKDAVTMIAQIVNSMAAPDRLLTDYEQGIVEQVVQEEIQECGTQGSITGVFKRLIAFKNIQTQEPDRIAGELAQSMRSYTEHGIFAKYFNGLEPVEFTSDFIVLELDGLAANPRLQATVLMIVMFQITQSTYSDRTRRKIVLIDEAWALMRDGATAKFIETGYRRIRKYNGQFVTITQSFADYFRTTAARAAYDNSSWKVAMYQPEESWTATFSSGQFEANPAQQQALRSLKTESGMYSEIFIKSPGGWGVGRLILDPFSLLEYSTKAEDFNAIMAYRKQGLGVTEAIESVLRDRGRL